MGQRWFDGYSANIEIFLLVAGKRHDVAQIGRGSLLLREPTSIPPATDARLTIRIDGHEEIEDVVLIQGAAVNDQPVPFL
jgi:hypothetical protein